MSQQFVLVCSIPGPVVQLDNQEKFVRANLGMPVTELCLSQGRALEAPCGWREKGCQQGASG